MFRRENRQEKTAHASVAGNYLFYLLQEMAILLSTIVVTPYISRILGAENIGVYSYTRSLVTYSMLLGTLGVALYGRREIAACGDDIEKRSIVFFNIILLRAISTLLSIILYIFVFRAIGDYLVLFTIQIIEIAASMFEITWLYQGNNKFHINALFSMVFRVLSTIAVFLFVKTKSDLNVYVLCMSLSTLGLNIAMWAKVGQIVKLPPLRNLKPFSILLPVLALFVPQIAIQIYQVMDKTMLYSLGKSTLESGLYEQSRKIINIATLLMTARSVSITPRLSVLYVNNEKEKIRLLLAESFQFVWFLGSPLFIGLLSLSGVFAPWFFGAEYSSVSNLMMVFSPIVIILGISNLLTVLYLSMGKSKEITIAAVTGAILNISLNWLLIPKLMSVGAVISSVLTEFAILCMWLFFIRNQISLKVIFTGMVTKFSSAVIAFASLPLLHWVCPWLSFIPLSILGSIVYFALLLVFRDDYARALLSKVRTGLGNR